MYPFRRRGFLAVAGGLAAIVLSATLLSSAAAKPSPTYRQTLQIQIHIPLKWAIEEGPRNMGVLVKGSKELCAEGQADEKAGEPASAESAWNALSEVVKENDKALLQAILDKTTDVHKSLKDLKSRFSKEWRNEPHKTIQLRLGVVKATHGAVLYVAGMMYLSVAFEHWEAHDCEGAQGAIDLTNEKVPPAVHAVNEGMKILKSLH